MDKAKFLIIGWSLYIVFILVISCYSFNFSFAMWIFAPFSWEAFKECWDDSYSKWGVEYKEVFESIFFLFLSSILTFLPIVIQIMMLK